MKSVSMFRPLRLANLAIGAALAVSATLAFAQAKPLAGQTVKIAWIDPLTGLMGPVGNNQLNTVRFMAEKYNATNPAGVKFEIVPFDNKLSPTESLNALKVGDRPGRALHHAGQRLVGGRWRWSTRSTSTTSATRARRCST